MRAILLSIGDELASGLTVNTNSAWLAQQLASLGITTLSHVTVGDQLAPIVSAIRHACATLGAVVGPFVAAGMMIVVGPKGFFWAAIGLHALLATLFLYRLRAWRAPLAKRPWGEVSLPARAFFVPATVVAMGRRYRSKRSR